MISRFNRVGLRRLATLARAQRHTYALPSVQLRLAACKTTSYRTGFTGLRAFSSDKKTVEAELFDEPEVVTTGESVSSSTNDASATGDFPESPVDKVLLDSQEKPATSTESHEFKAETRKILDIVANSLYTDKEVFIRELISNSSDALEKVRFLQTNQQDQMFEPERELSIHITTDVDNKTITFQDFGVGMNADELVNNLGTIARSGSKQFVEQMSDKGDASSGIIGQFGVGFYSSLMVGDTVEVYSRSALKQADGSDPKGFYWKTDGSGAYDLGEAEGVMRGTKIIVNLKPDAHNFAVRHTIEGIVKKYSNFVGCPIYLNGEVVNTVDALWARDPREVTEEDHVNFYHYLANAFDVPPFKLHFRIDAPIAINGLFYFPERHMEKMGMGRLEPGVSIYSRKVLIQSKSTAIMPDWARFVKGVVDCEDIPLNISRENMQDSGLILRLKTILTKRIIKFLSTMGIKEPDKYNSWFQEFGQFIKEGVCTDFANKDQIAKLIRYDTSLLDDDTDAPPSVSLDEYVSRMAPDQGAIYYLSAPSRKFAMESPYFEAFNSKGIEVLFLYQPIDDFVMKNLDTYENRKLVSIESTEASDHLDVDKKADETSEETKAAHKSVVDMIQEALSSKVSDVSVSTRLTNTPAIVVDHESAAFRRMMKMVDQQQADMLPKQKLEVNADHPIFLNALALRDVNPALSDMLIEQVFDNALIAADILDSPRSMLPRINAILESIKPGMKE